MDEKLDRIKGALYGFAIGDSMGATTEFMTDIEIREKLGMVYEIVGGGWLNLKAGDPTDDTDMTICVMKALIEDDLVNFEKNVADFFVEWYKTNPKDIGKQCNFAIEYYIDNEKFVEIDDTALGNGSLMRSLPCALRGRDYIELNVKQGRITHNNKICDDIIREYSDIIIKNIHGINCDTYEKKLMPPSGYIVNTFNNAIYWAQKPSIKECIISAVNHGGDSDTIAAIAGSISGSKYGYTSIPNTWIDQLSSKTKLEIEKFLEYITTK